MKNLLKFEFHKLFRQKSFYVCTGVILALSLFALLLTKALVNNPDADAVMPSAKSAMLSAISSSSFTVVCGIFIALFVCTDYDRQTIKNVYARGFSRNGVFVAKFLASAVATLAMFAVTLLFTFAAANNMFDGKTEAGNYIGLIVGQILYALAYAAFVFAVSFIVKKVGVSVALAILGPSLIGTVLNLADAFLKTDNFKFGKYWLDGFVADLSTVATDNTRLAVCILLSALYAAVFLIAGYCINKKQEN